MRKKALSLFCATSSLVVVGYCVALFLLCDFITTREIYCAKISPFAEYYEKNIRGHLFSGFLALGGFLLSLKTFIIVNMKENVYDDDNYQENWRKQLKSNPSLKLYGPLKELSDLLYYAILATILSAILQMTLGLYTHWVASVICILSALYATALLVSSLILIKQNLDAWFSYLDK